MSRTMLLACIRTLIVVALSLGLFVGCSSAAQPTIQPSSIPISNLIPHATAGTVRSSAASAPPFVPSVDDGKLDIVFVTRTPHEPFTATMLSGAMQAAADVRTRIKVHHPASPDPAIQAALVEKLLMLGDVDYLIVDAADPVQLVPMLEQAHKAGVAVITVHNFIGDGNYESGSVTFPLIHIGSDDFAVGYEACQGLIDRIEPSAAIYIAPTPLSGSALSRREAGCRSAAARFGRTVIGAQAHAAKHELATHAPDVLAANRSIQGVFAINSATAQAISDKLKQLGRSNVQLVTFGVTPSTVDLLSSAVATQMIADKPFDMGYLAVALAVAHGKGYLSLPHQLLTNTSILDAHSLKQGTLDDVIYSQDARPLAPPLHDFTVAFVPGAHFPFYATMYPGAKQAAEMYGLRLIRRIPDSFDSNVQIPLIKQLMTEQTIDYLIVSPTDKDTLIPVLEEIHASGIPVITVDTFIGDGDYTDGPVRFPLAYIGSDNVQGGYIACSQLALAAFGGVGAKIYIQNAAQGISSTDDRAKGCRVAAEDFGLEVVDEKFAYREATSEQAARTSRSQTAAVLSEHSDIAGIFATVNFLALGTGEAVVAAGLGGVVEVVAFDVNKPTVDQLHNGVITQMVAQKPGDMGYFAVLATVAHARGVESIPRRWSTGFVVMNKDNVDQPEVARFIYQEE